MIRSSVNRPSSDYTVLELDGRIDRNTAPQFRNDCLKVAREQGHSQLEINLTKALCTDTSSIAVMVEILKAVRKKGGKLKISGIDETTARLISLSQLDEVFEDVIVEPKS